MARGERVLSDAEWRAEVEDAMRAIRRNAGRARSARAEGRDSTRAA